MKDEKNSSDFFIEMMSKLEGIVGSFYGQTYTDDEILKKIKKWLEKVKERETMEKLEKQGIKKYQVWSEGYYTKGHIEGNEDVIYKASFEGEKYSDSFEQACVNLVGHRMDRKDKNRKPKQHKLLSEFKEPLSITGRKLFEKEEDARRAFG